ncbi:terminase small subunit [Clostridium perfringens]|uniref:Terminase small subunit n=1 Tax=Clostridium perfringens TaxID=1502 RepID=A0AAP4AC50_CLOPF|nr:terminase small subunit [Clostridium perfringens]MDH2337305.1 terminase small subunit [Clostridium perfringens]
MSKPQYELAEADYKNGMKYKDIAEKYGVSINTVKSWKTRYKWSKKSVHTKEEKVCTQINKKVNKKSKKKEPIAEEVKEVLENTELTDKQRLFCIYYIKRFNATKAYQKAYGCSYETALVNGPRLLGNARIQEEIQDLKEGKLNRIMISEEDIFQKYMDIAFSDIGDYLTFKKVRKNKWTKNEQGEYIPAINPDTGQQDYFEYNVVELNNSKGLDTSILQEISEGKDGVKIKLQDKMKALQWLSDHMGIATEEQKLKIAKLKGEVNKLNGTNENTGPIEIVIKRKGED